jgi:hypothetical protein
VLLVIGVGIWLGVQHLHYVEFAELQDLVRRTKKRKQVFANNLEIRRAAESLNSCSEFATICRILESALQPLGFDGFKLKNSLMGCISERFVAPLRRTADDGFQYSWYETTSPDPPWELRLELITSSGYRMGHFSLFRTWIKDPLLLDVDLFSCEFRSALSGALHRTLIRIQVSARREVRGGSTSAVVASALSTD